MNTRERVYQAIRRGHRAMAEAMVARAGAVRDGEFVPLQPALARRLGIA